MNVVLLWFCTVWVLAVPCLTDGTEGNRMRFAVSPALTLLVMLLLNEVTTGIRRRFQPRSRAGRAPEAPREERGG